MNYWEKWATHPLEVVSVGTSICLALMGFVDALVFSLREKPWRTCEGGDGTFWGSFTWTRDPGDGVAEGAAPSWGRPSSSYRTSASGEFAKIAAEQARIRLELEREERFAVLGLQQGKRLKGRGDDVGARERNGGGWLNVGDGAEGQVYDDMGLEDDTV